MPKKRKFENEWYLYSNAAITGILVFWSLTVWTGTPQAIGVAFSTIAGGILLASNNWKAIEPEIHRGIVVCAVLAFLGCLAIYSHFHPPNKVKS